MTPVNYSFETSSRAVSNDSRLKKYRPNTPGSAYHEQQSIIADASPILNPSTSSRKLITPGITPLHMMMPNNNNNNNATPHNHHHHHHHHRHHRHHSHHHHNHNNNNNNNNPSTNNNNTSSSSGQNYIRLCYLKPNSTTEFECKNIKINNENNSSGGNGEYVIGTPPSYGCSLDDLKKKKKMKFLGVFKEAPSSASYDTMDSWISSSARPESRMKYPENVSY